MRKSCALAFSTLWLSSAVQASPQTFGYFEGEVGLGGAKNRLCVSRITGGRLDVTLSTAYCPSKECLNARIDGYSFQSQLKHAEASYEDRSRCKISIQFSESGARVSQSDECRNDEHPYLYAAGFYNFVRPDLQQDDCGP